PERRGTGVAAAHADFSPFLPSCGNKRRCRRVALIGRVVGLHPRPGCSTGKSGNKMIHTQRLLIAFGLATGIHFTPASATPAYHALVLGIADGRSSVQIANPVGLNRWGQVLGTYGQSNAGGTHAVLWNPTSDNDGSGVGATLFPLENSSGFPAGSTSTFSTGFSDR